MVQHIIVCVADERLAHPLCDYGVYLSNTTGLPLMFLHVVEPITSVEINMVGNLILGEKEELLKEFTAEEEKESKEKIKEARELLHALKARALLKATQKIELKLFHGEFLETLLSLKEQARVFVLGLQSSKTDTIGENIVECVKSVHTPVLLISDEFVKPEKLLIDCNGSKEAKTLLQDIANRPLFGTIEREIVTFGSDMPSAHKILDEAKSFFANNDIEVNTHAIEGNPQERLFEYFEQNNFDILARGAFSQSLLKEFFFGSVTKEILGKTKKPLLLIR
jgi:Universal stress protein UspA and related nucleotide-binding proteins